MKALISSNAVRLFGLAMLAVAMWFSPAEALTPECEEFAGCQLCTNDHCEFLICDDYHRVVCKFD